MPNAVLAPELLLLSQQSAVFSHPHVLTVSHVMQAHPASAAAAAVLVAQASVGVSGGVDKYNADGTSYAGGMCDVEQGMGQGGDVINAAPLLRQQTFGPVRFRVLGSPLNLTCLCCMGIRCVCIHHVSASAQTFQQGCSCCCG